MITITGFAGTGKTYMISKLVSVLGAKVAMTAPTNKAVKVLADNKPEEFSGMDYLTIHKLLALRMKWIYPKAGQNFKPYQKLVKTWGAESSLCTYGVLILDEVSMLDDELFNLLRKENYGTKVIFLGDAAQIPPVGKPDSIPLMSVKRKEFGLEYFELNQTMRQAEGSGILGTASCIRDNRFSDGEVIADRTNCDDTFFDHPDNMMAFMQDIKFDFTSDRFQEDPNFAKVIAWRNVTVDAFNRLIRQLIYKKKDLPFLMEGEKLIADSPVIKKSEYGSNILFSTSDEFEVIDYTETTEVHYPNSESKSDDLIKNLLGEDVADTSQLHFTFRYCRTRVRTVRGEEEMIDILLPESYDSLKKAIGVAFGKKKFDIYEELSDRFAKVKYNYAITAHKSQGSTYENVYIIEDDIDRNKTTIERNRIKYTAVSRASKKLRILSRRNL